MRKSVVASAALGVLAALAFSQTASAAVTYAYAGTADVWDLSFTYTSPVAIDQPSSIVVPCTDNHGDTSCTLDFYFAGTPQYLYPDNALIGPYADHDVIGVQSTNGLGGGGGALGCCIGYNLFLEAGALTHDGVHQSTLGRGSVTISGIPDTSGTPEPAAWALMILGFGATGLALRQRRPRLA